MHQVSAKVTETALLRRIINPPAPFDCNGTRPHYNDYSDDDPLGGHTRFAHPSFMSIARKFYWGISFSLFIFLLFTFYFFFVGQEALSENGYQSAP